MKAYRLEVNTLLITLGDKVAIDELARRAAMAMRIKPAPNFFSKKGLLSLRLIPVHSFRIDDLKGNPDG